MSASFITNISFPKSLDEVLYFIEERGKFDVQEVMTASYVEWTAPRDSRIGDTAYFMHSKTSIDTIGHLRKELELNRARIGSDAREALFAALDQGEELYEGIGGAIFARGIVCGDIVVDDIATRDGLHWRSRYYAPIDSIALIEPPISIDEFRSFITISRTGAITKLTPEQNAKLQALRS